MNIYTRVLVNRQNYALRLRLTKTFGFDTDVVAADREGEDDVLSSEPVSAFRVKPVSELTAITLAPTTTADELRSLCRESLLSFPSVPEWPPHQRNTRHHQQQDILAIHMRLIR